MFQFVQLFSKRHDDTGCGNTKGGLRYDTAAHWKVGGMFFSRYMAAVGKEIRYVVFARMRWSLGIGAV